MSDTNSLKECLCKVRKLENDIYLMNHFLQRCDEIYKQGIDKMHDLKRCTLDNSEYSEAKNYVKKSEFIKKGLIIILFTYIALLVLVGAITGTISWFITHKSSSVMTTIKWSSIIVTGIMLYTFFTDFKHNLDYYDYYQRHKKYNEAEQEYQRIEKDVYHLKSKIDNFDYNAIELAKKRLEIMYSQDTIYTKYRNLIAVNQISEYIDSGRCSELEGPNGAYNLFESELRHNVIIGKLEVVINQLEQIRQGQFYIYQAIRDTQDAIENMDVSVVTNTYIDGVRY